MRLPHLHKWKKIEAKASVGEERLDVGVVMIRQCERCGAIDREGAVREARKRYFKLIEGGG